MLPNTQMHNIKYVKLNLYLLTQVYFEGGIKENTNIILIFTMWVRGKHV